MEEEKEKIEEDVKVQEEEENVPRRRSTRRPIAPAPVQVKAVKKGAKPTGNSLLDMMNNLDDQQDDQSDYSEQSESSSSSSSSSQQQVDEQKSPSKRAAKQAKIIRKEQEKQQTSNHNQLPQNNPEQQQHNPQIYPNQNYPDPCPLPQDLNNIPQSFKYELPKMLPNFLVSKMVSKYK